MDRTLIKDLGGHIGEEVTVKGWVDVARHQSKMSFLNIRDRSGKVQCVAIGVALEHGEVKDIRSEWVIEAIGVVKKRPEKNVKPGMQNGDIELQISAITIIS